MSVSGGSAFWPASYRCLGETTISLTVTLGVQSWLMVCASAETEAAAVMRHAARMAKILWRIILGPCGYEPGRRVKVADRRQEDIHRVSHLIIADCISSILIVAPGQSP